MNTQNVMWMSETVRPINTSLPSGNTGAQGTLTYLVVLSAVLIIGMVALTLLTFHYFTKSKCTCQDKSGFDSTLQSVSSSEGEPIPFGFKKISTDHSDSLYYPSLPIQAALIASQPRSSSLH